MSEPVAARFEFAIGDGFAGPSHDHGRLVSALSDVLSRIHTSISPSGGPVFAGPEQAP
jgi:hypothetical protein